MNTEYVRYFIAACEYGSILEASKNLYISAQGLGAGIHRLEKSIGIKLLDYHYNGVSPTEFGQSFYEQAVVACREVERLEQLAKEYRESRRDIITLGTVGNTKFCHGLKSGIQEFQKKYPDIDLTGKVICREDGSDLVADVKEGNIDIGLLFHKSVHKELEYYTISPFSRLMLLISKEHPLASKKHVMWKDLKDLKYVFAAPLDPFMNLMNAVCADFGFVPETVFYSTENSQNARYLDGNLCAMFMRESYADNILQFCHNSVLLPVEPEVSVACSLFWRKDHKFEGDKKLFLDSLLEYSSMIF